MPALSIEHFAYNVSDPVAVAAWYVKNLGMRVVVHNPAAFERHFIADTSRRVVMEIYANPADPVPDYAAMHPLRFHIAFAATDLDAVKAELVAAGATFLNEDNYPDGSRLMMLRDPWGLALQLVKRATPLL